MRGRFTVIVIILLSVSILFQSCLGTIISTSKQRVIINSEPRSATVYLNGEKLEQTPTKVRIKRKTGGEIKVEKEGYKPHYEILYPAKVNPLAYFSLLFLLYPYYVDVATGAIYRLNKKQVDVDMIKIPNTIEGSEYVYCDEVSLKVKAGDKLGNFFIRDTRDEILYFGKSLNIDALDLKENTNNVLKDLGFDVAGSKGSLFSPVAQSKFFVRAKVVDIRYDIKASNKYEHLAKFETICRMDVEWELTNRNNEVVFGKKTQGLSVKYESGGTAAFYDAFENALYEFLYNEDIYEMVKKGNNAANEASLNLSPIKILKPSINSDSEKLINHATESIVTISNHNSHGSGCIISEDGYIVTNQHVVEGVDKVLVSFKSGFTIEGNVVRRNTEYDLALVKVNASGFVPIPILEDEEINIGSDIYAIGTPADKSLGQTVTKGIISGVRKMFDKQFIQTDVSINPGSSGGGLVNKKGYLVGIVNAKLVGESVEGIGFAIPAYVVLDKLNIQY